MAGALAECLTYCYLRSLVMHHLFTITSLQGPLNALAIITRPAGVVLASTQALHLNSLLYMMVVDDRSTACS